MSLRCVRSFDDCYCKPGYKRFKAPRFAPFADKFTHGKSALDRERGQGHSMKQKMSGKIHGTIGYCAKKPREPRP